MKQIIIILMGVLMTSTSLFAQINYPNKDELRTRIINRIHLKNIKPNERAVFLNQMSYQSQTADLKLRLDSFVVFDSTLAINTIRNLYLFDSKNRNTSFDFFIWDNTNAKWMGFIHATFIYDASDRIIETQSGDWNASTNSFDITYRTLRQYNGNGQLTKDSSYAFQSGIWELDEKNDYTIINGKVSSVTNSTHDGVDWSFYQKNDYTYDGSGNLIEDYEYEWDLITLSWLNHTRTLSSYNASNKLTEQIISNWDFNLINFVNSSRQVYTYDLLGLKTSQLAQSWDRQNSIWLNEELIELKYSSGKNPEELKISRWDSKNLIWVQGSLTLATFDELFKNKDMILPVLDIFSLFFQLDAFENGRPLYLILYEIKKANGEWKNKNRMTFYYSQQIVNRIEDEDERRLIVYPNPTTGYLIFDAPLKSGTFFITTIEGHVQLAGNYVDGNLINVSDLPGGFYLLFVRDHNRLYLRSRFVKR